MCPAINNQILGLRGLGKSSLFTNETSQTLLIDKYLTTVVESTYTNGSNLFKKTFTLACTTVIKPVWVTELYTWLN